MIHVLIDTTIYRKDPCRQKVEFQTIARLADAGLIKLHIPHVVLHEFATWLQAEYTNDLRDIKKALKSIEGLPLSDSNRVEVRRMKYQIEGLTKSLEGHAEREFTAWAGQHAKVHPIGPEHGNAVMTAYFAGKPPFKAAKARDDIPDAFIYQTVSDLARGGESPVIIITADKQLLTKVMENIINATTFASIEDWLNSEQGKGLVGRESTDRVKGYLRSVLARRSDRLLSDVEGQVRELVEGREVKYSIPPYDLLATVADLDSAANGLVDTDKVTDYGDGIFAVSFWQEFYTWLSYHIRKEVYYALPLSSRETIGIESELSELGDEYGAGAYCLLKVAGDVVINLGLEAESPGITECDVECLLTPEKLSVEIKELTYI